jgi:hypothetical protein
VLLPQWRGSISRNGKSTSRLPKKYTVIRSISIACEASDTSLEETTVAFEEVYQVRAKLSMANMATIVQELGLVTGKNTVAKRGNLTSHAHSS